MSWKFCHLCGGKLKSLSEHSFQCEACEQVIYRNAVATTDAAIINSSDELLVVKRGREPYLGQYDLPGGFIDIGETPEQAIVRELGEELGIKPQDITNISYLISGPTTYPWGKEVVYLQSITFLININEPVQLVANDDVTSFEWKKLTEIDKNFFAFDSQNNYVTPALLSRFQK